MAQVLQPLSTIFPKEDYPALLIGLDEPDDAAVYQIGDDRAIITTTDFFPPVVDDPYAFGAIAAANALSDVYAMGGTPLMAINLVAFPDGLAQTILTEILRGGAETVREAGAVISGGHTVTDAEPKYGLSVTGQVHPRKIIRKGGAQVGDSLILTKPLGTGVVTTAIKRGIASQAAIEAVITGMRRLNRIPAEVAQRYNNIATAAQNPPVVHAMTDITGYGLTGHGHELAHLSHVDLHIEFHALQWYPLVLPYAEDDIFPGGMHRNRDYFQQWVRLDAPLAEWEDYLLYDPQTSGGMLMAVDASVATDILNDLNDAGENAFIIGTVHEGAGHLVIKN